ncbi:MAG: tetratricopeptide repeat protein [Proteobacteria bacterium]|nr:tetratricopeptide repeat protein [Pseudomonadota bacterium]
MSSRKKKEQEMNGQANNKDQDADLSVREEFQLHLSKGREALEMNNLVEAKDELESALDLEPGSEQAQNLLAMVFFKLEEYSRAIRMFRSLVAKNPKVTSLHVNLGLAYLKKEDYRRAIDSLKKVIEMDADHRGAHNYLGLSYSKLNEYQNAKEEFELAGAIKMAKKMDELIRQQAPEHPKPEKDQETIRGEQRILESQPNEVVDLPEDIERIRPPEITPAPEPPPVPAPEPPPVVAPEPPPAPEPVAEAEEEIEGFKLVQEEGAYSTFSMDESPEKEPPAPEPEVKAPPAPEPIPPPVLIPEEKAETERLESPIRMETQPPVPEQPRPAPEPEPERAPEPEPEKAPEPQAAPAVEAKESPREEAKEPEPKPEAEAAPESPEEEPAEPAVEAEALPTTQFSTVEVPDKGVFLEFSEIGADTAIRMGNNSYAISQKDKGALIRFQALSGCKGGYQIELKHKRFKGKETRLVFGGEKNPVVEFKGAGVLMISAPEGDTYNLDPQGEILYISEAFLLAAQGDLQWENGKVPLKDSGELNLVRFQGSGYVLVSLPGKLHAMSLSEGESFSMLPPMLVGWMGNLVPLVKEIVLTPEEGKEKEKPKAKEKEKEKDKEEIKRLLLEMKGTGKVFFYLPTSQR